MESDNSQHATELHEDGMWRLLGHAVSSRAAQDQVLWAIFGVFWAANALLLIPLFPEGNFAEFHIGVIIGFVGLFFSIVWLLIQSRALRQIVAWESLRDRIEGKLKIPKDLALGKAAAHSDVKGVVSVSQFEIVPCPIRHARVRLNMRRSLVGCDRDVFCSLA